MTQRLILPDSVTAISPGQPVRLSGRLALVVAALCTTLLTNANAARVSAPDELTCSAADARPDRNASLQEQTVATPASTIGYYRFGHGSPIVLITGYRASMGEWNASLLGELARTHDVIVFDNRGIGKSASQYIDYGIEDMASDAAALITGLKLVHPTVLGWSMGGMVAQQLALRRPELVDKLVLMNTMPPGRAAVPTSGAVRQALSGEGPEHFDRVMEILFPVSVVAWAKQCFLADMFAPPGYGSPEIPDTVTRSQRAALDNWKTDDSAFQQLKKLKIPTLILAGADDRVLISQNARALAAIIPNARLTMIANAGHAMMYRYPSMLAVRIDTFLSR